MFRTITGERRLSNIVSEGSTVLQAASRSERGRLKASSETLEWADCFQKAVLHEATERGRTDVVEKLLHSRADFQ